MNVPNIISDLLAAQAHFDSKAYADCFLETAFVFDENKTHKGHKEIEKWNEKTNEMYQSQLEVLDFKENTMIAKTSGNFEGSPIVLKYHFEFEREKIASLKITI